MKCLAGELPFYSTDPFELVHSHIAVSAPDASELNVDIPKSLAKLIQKLMAKDPSERYQSAIGIKQDLEECAKGDDKVICVRANGCPRHFKYLSKDVWKAR